MTKQKQSQLEKILIVDDSSDRITNARRLFGERIVNAGVETMDENYHEHDIPTREKNLTAALQQEKYAVILMDGNLELIEGTYFDGIPVSKNIRTGVYGLLNQETPIVNISSHTENPYARSRANLDFQRETPEKRLEQLRKQILEGQ